MGADVYEYTELYGRPMYLIHQAAPGLPTRVLTVCGRPLEGMLSADGCEAGVPDRWCDGCPRPDA